jgi:hypothetical protein
MTIAQTVLCLAVLGLLLASEPLETMGPLDGRWGAYSLAAAMALSVVLALSLG